MGKIKLDFIVLAQPRSGTHFLAFALDSHDEINMHGEVQFPNRHREKWSNRGNVTGAICPSYCTDMVETDKAIVLTRNQKLRYQEGRVFAKHYSTHYFEPTKLTASQESPYSIERCEELQKQLLEAADKYKKKFFITYEELSEQCKNLKYSTEISHRLCKFIGVTNKTLITKTYKPSIIY